MPRIGLKIPEDVEDMSVLDEERPTSGREFNPCNQVGTENTIHVQGFIQTVVH